MQMANNTRDDALWDNSTNPPHIRAIVQPRPPQIKIGDKVDGIKPFSKDNSLSQKEWCEACNKVSAHAYTIMGCDPSLCQ